MFGEMFKNGHVILEMSFMENADWTFREMYVSDLNLLWAKSSQILRSKGTISPIILVTFCMHGN